MKHPGHTYGGFVPTISEWGMTLPWRTRLSEHWTASRTNIELAATAVVVAELRDLCL
jgi:hypothetical protein